MRPNYSLQPWCQAGVGRGSNISRCCNAESQKSSERLSWVFWWPGDLYTFRQFLQLSRLCDLMRVCRAGCYCCVVFWWLFRPITVLVGVRFKPGLSSPPLALDMCKQNICMANITNKTNATSLFRPLQCWQPFLKYMVALSEGVGQPSCHSAEYQGREHSLTRARGPLWHN